MKKSVSYTPIIGLLMVCFLVAGLMACSAADKKKTGDYWDDSVITTKVKAKIADDSSSKAFKTSVETRDGVVTLTGEVNSQDAVKRIGEIAKSVHGVKAVNNKLVVR